MAAKRKFCSTSRIVKPCGLEPPDRRADLLDDDRGQPLGRLVQQQQAGAGAQDAADGQHLLLAAGELGALAPPPLPQVREQLEDRLERRARPAAPPGAAAGSPPRSGSRRCRAPPGRRRGPRRAMRLDGRSISSSPWKRTEPGAPRHDAHDRLERGGLAGPVAARGASPPRPARTSKSTPWSTWDSPYQAWRPATCSSGLTHGRRPGRPGPPRDGPTPSRSRPRRGSRPRASTVMVSERFSTTLRLCSTISTVRFFATCLIRAEMRSTSSWAMPGGRLVEQHHLRVERERGRDLERALAPVGQLDRQGPREAARARPRRAARARAPSQVVEHALRAPEVEGAPAPPLERDAHVLQRA